MQYLGGKTRNAKEIAARIAPRSLWWEPFCGGLSMSIALSEYGRGISSDFHPALIALYQAILAGWAPPDSISEEEYSLLWSKKHSLSVAGGCQQEARTEKLFLIS